MSYWKSLCVGVLLARALVGGAAESKPRVEIVHDLLVAFDASQVRDALKCEVQRPATAGGIRQNALYQHPKFVERPAQVGFDLDLPNVRADELLVLAFDMGLTDGIVFGAAEDGVRFGVEVNGQKVFSRDSRESRWQSQAVDLTSWAGGRMKLSLLTEGLRTLNHDWAVWGEPRVLRFRGPRGKLAGPIAFTAGAIALSYPSDKPLTLRLKPLGEGKIVEWQTAGAPSAPVERHWLVKDFSFPGASGFEIDWEPKEALSAEQIWLAPYSPQPKLVQVSAVRAVSLGGENVPLRVELVNEGRGTLEAGEARVELQVGQESLPPRQLPTLAPGETWRAEWLWRSPVKNSTYPVQARLLMPEFSTQTNANVEIFAAAKARSVENDYLKLEFVRQPDGYAHANILAREGETWKRVGVWRPLFRVISDQKQGEKDWEIRPRKISMQKQAATFEERIRDADGVEWQVRLRVELLQGQPLARLRYEWKTAQPRQVKALWGPNLYVGDGASGEAKSGGLFPGLEYLYGPERSSNPRDFAPSLADRRTPHPHKITVPLMAVTIGPDSQEPPAKPGRFFTPDSLKDSGNISSPSPLGGERVGVRGVSSFQLKSEVTIALFWDPLQKWDGQHAFPSARFASPNFDEGMANHRLGLFLPSVPDFVPENSDRARKPYALAAGQTLTLDASLVVTPGPVLTALREWHRSVGGLPKPNDWPRSFQEELDVCRAGFLKTVWDEQNEKWRHCIGWGSSHAPGFASLLWLDSQLAEKPEARQQSRARVELAVTNMLRDGGPAQFASQANCHILQWEFPFLYGHLPDALATLESQIRNLIDTQQPAGGWLYQPANDQQADLGRAGDSVLGTCAMKAATLLRYARITGDTNALAAGEKALWFMERFRVPRGGQTWECPMYEPDILAAAHAIRAYTDAWRVTANARWLHDAVYWAETGLPFIYQWTLPEKPMMLGAAIPVFGSSFYTHTWLALPVQWCGLVYTYHLFHLAEELERSALPKTDSPLPLALNFSPRDWKRVVELVTVSGLHQQYADGERMGSYPDSITRFEQRNPAFLNPEDILVNVLALKDHDPDVKTARLKTDRGEIVISSGARIVQPRTTRGGIRFQLEFFLGEPSHTLVTHLKPRTVRANGSELIQSERPLQRESGWWWDGQRSRLYLTVPHAQEKVDVEIDYQ